MNDGGWAQTKMSQGKDWPSVSEGSPGRLAVGFLRSTLKVLRTTALLKRAGGEPRAHSLNLLGFRICSV